MAQSASTAPLHCWHDGLHPFCARLCNIADAAAHHHGLNQLTSLVLSNSCVPWAVILCLIPAGHSLGGFTAAACAVFFQEVLKVVTFESPGLTTFCECCPFVILNLHNALINVSAGI